MRPTLIIAEAGVNHNGDISLAKKLIDVAAEAGADYVKFQTFKTEKIVTPAAKKADYQIQNMNNNESESQFSMLKKLELSVDAHHELIAYCEQKNIRFLSTAFDLESVDFLKSLGLELFKIPSGEITNLPYLQKIGAFNTKVVVSTGMCVAEEIGEAIIALEKAGTNRNNITLLHCTTDYPTNMKDVNLKAMQTIGKLFNLPVGYSDHTLGIEVPIAAVALGAQIIEKHFTLDKKMDGPDHKASLEPHELKAMVKGIRNIEVAMSAAGAKVPTENENKNKLVARKSIHVSKDLKSGEIITEKCLIALRPGDGISPMEWYNVIGKKTTREIEAGTKITWEDLD
ncbi:MAG: legI [Bacteroidetes bacterium]|jgi:N-acetylneuraminate synthase/N,N'-diacetyllegionaminate synthase|nr:legI [Bacteroidota bacterium]